MRALGAAAGLALVGLALGGCPSPRLPSGGRGGCEALGPRACKDADGLVAAISAFSNVEHELLLDPSSAYAPGRGVARGPGGRYTLTTQACAAPRSGSAAIDAATVDFGYVGLAIDDAVVSADADLTPLLGAGASGEVHTLKLVAVAFVRDKDPQFFSPGPGLTYEGDRCACGGATAFVGSVKIGGMLSYEIKVRAGEVRGRALDFVKSKLRAEDAEVRQVVVGGLELDNLDEVRTKGARARPLGFRVKSPVPVAYTLFPLGDVCRFTLAEPDVSPPVLDFGDVPAGREATRLVHVVNRSPLELEAVVQGTSHTVPPLGAVDLPLVARPAGGEPACEVVHKDETLVFRPREDAPVTPKRHSAKVETVLRTGPAEVTRVEHVDSGETRFHDWALVPRDVACPPSYVAVGCATEREDGCAEAGVRVEGRAEGGACRFSVRARSSIIPTLRSQHCRYEGVATCRMKCDP